jgi:hypothetical protein
MKRIAIVALLAWSALCTPVLAQSGALQVFPQVVEMNFQEGYVVYTDEGKVAKNVPGPASATIKAKSSGKSFASGEVYLSDWSYGQLQKGKNPNWIVGNNLTAAVNVARGSTSPPADALPFAPVITPMDASTAKFNQTTSEERATEIAPIAQTQPSAPLVGASASRNRKYLAAATEGNVFIYELPSGRLLKTLLAASFTDGRIEGIYFGNDEDSLFFVATTPGASEDYQASPLTVHKLNWQRVQAIPLFKVSGGKIIGFSQPKEIFALSDASPERPQGTNQIHELSAQGMVTKSHWINHATAAVFADDGSLVVIMNDDGDGMKIGGISVIKDNERRDWEGIEAVAQLGRIMQLPPSVLASPIFADAQEVVPSDFGRLPLGPSLLLCQEPGVFVGKNPILNVAVSRGDSITVRRLASDQLLAVEGVATTDNGAKLLAWPINGQGEGVTNDKESLSHNFKPDGLPLLFNLQTWETQWMDTGDDIVVNGALSPNGDLACLVRTSFAELREQPQAYRLTVERLEDRKQVAVYSESGGQSLSYTFENNMIDPDRALIESAVQFGGGVYDFQPCLWTLHSDGSQITVRKDSKLETTQNEGFWSFGRPPSSLRFAMSACDTGAKAEWSNTGPDQAPGANLKVVPANGGSNAVVPIDERVSAAYPINEEFILVAGNLGVSTIGASSSRALSEWTMPQALDRWSVQAIQRAAFAPSSGKLYRGADDGSIFLLDYSKDGAVKKVARIFVQNLAGPVFVTPDNFFASPSAGNGIVHFSDGIKAYPFEQFDLRLNRPDIVLERLGAPAEAVAIAKQLREKRLKRMGVTEEMLKPDLHVPELEIVGDVPANTDVNEISLAIKANDTKYPLDRLKVFVNNVPVNGRDGESLRDQKTQTLERTIPTKLATGRNKIQISVLNNAGAESLYANAEVNCTAERSKPTLYAVALGVSDYANPDWNLKYAGKDARDVLERLKTRSGASYGEVKELLLTDKQVTKDSVGQIKDFLRGATIDDTVLMFVAGHGLLDSQYDYYFGTNDIDFNNPAEKGIAFDEFDDLLAGLPSLKKSLLIDTCHAGELDEEEKTLLASAGGTAAPLPTGNGIAMHSIGTRGMNVKAIEGARGASEWYDRLQGLFVDLRRGSGSTILSSSAGAEYALESSEQQNGLFTYAVLEALDGKKEADTDKDGSIEMSELGEYVKKRVSELTNNKQTPNTRRVNLEGDFTLAKTE